MIISLVLILAALVIAFNFEKFTGQATTNIAQTKLYLSADPEIADQGEIAVNKGQAIYITVDTGSKGSSGTVIIYDVNSAKQRRVLTTELKNCSPNQCKAGVIGTGKISAYYNWNGKYCATVKDIVTRKDVKSCFTVI
ncbi:MAG: hypothetical protein V1645_02890 [archaeon]